MAVKTFDILPLPVIHCDSLPLDAPLLTGARNFWLILYVSDDGPRIETCRTCSCK